MPEGFYKDLIELLTEAGCFRIRSGKGSHEIWHSPISNRSFTLPQSKSRHTANNVLKDAGLPKAF